MGSPGAGPAGQQPERGPDVPAGVLRAWDQAEARLFPLVMARPDLYERAVGMIRVLVAGLRVTCPDIAALLAAEQRGGALVTDAWPDLVSELGEGAVGGADGGIAPELVAAAACAMRYRELVAQRAAQRRLAALARARQEGLDWAVIEESGAEARAPYVPYQRVEAHMATGRVLIVSVEPDETLTAAVRRLDAGELDTETGGLSIGEAIGSYPDPGALASALQQARAGIADPQ
jgi:hypothetical protein